MDGEKIMIVHEKIIAVLKKLPMETLLERYDDDRTFIVYPRELFPHSKISKMVTYNFDTYCRKRSRIEFIMFITSLT